MSQKTIIYYKSKNTLEVRGVNFKEEGCLSIPGHFAEVARPSKCKVQYLDYNGKTQIIDADDLLSTCIQHEVDHCDGILFIDYLSKLKKDMI